MGVHIVGIEAYGAAEEVDAPRHVIAIVAVPSLQKIVIGDPILRRLAAGLFGAARHEAAAKGRDDRPTYLVLDGKDVLNVAVIPLRPKVILCRGIDQLCRHADAAGGLSYAAFH